MQIADTQWHGFVSTVEFWWRLAWPSPQVKARRPEKAASAKSDGYLTFVQYRVDWGGRSNRHAGHTLRHAGCPPHKRKPSARQRGQGGARGGLNKPHEMQCLLAIKATWP